MQIIEKRFLCYLREKNCLFSFFSSVTYVVLPDEKSKEGGRVLLEAIQLSESACAARLQGGDVKSILNFLPLVFLFFYYCKNYLMSTLAMGSSIVLKSLSVLLGIFFVFIGLMKITSLLNKELHKDVVS